MATADNLKIAQQLLATMQQITAQVEKQTEAYHAQAQLVDALCKAQECFGDIDSAKVKEVTESLREAQEQTKEFGNEVKSVGEKELGKFEKIIKNIGEQVKKISVPAEFLNGFKTGFTLSKNLFKNILSLGGSAIGLLKDMGRILLSLPGRLLDYFQGAAGSGTDEYKSALEELRKEFGDLDIGTSAAIKNMTESTKDLGESGLALSRVFGYGRAGLAALLRENMALIKEMGPLGNRLAESIKGAEGEFTLLRKATAISGEAFKSFQLSVEESGGDGVKAVREMTKSIAQFTREFGISSKEYGRDLDFMMKDTQTFGIMAPKEMLKVSTYAKRLGVSVESLKKVVEKSLNFESAAEQAAKLSEAFNIQIDAMKQMKETDPTKKLDNIRQAFFKTGRSIEQLNVQERRYLGAQLDMSDAELRLAFSQKNRALSGAALDAQMKKSKKTQISQAEAMQNLAKSIERLIQSGSPMKGGFFETFFKGFEGGIKRTKEFREIVYNVQRIMRTILLAGREVGRMFVKEFPSIKQILGGIADMFDPARFRELLKGVVEEFKKFFKTVQTDPKAGVEAFMKNMKKIFFDFFTKGAPAGAKFLDGLKTFYKTIGLIFVEGLRQALMGLKNVLGIVIGFIRDPSSLKRLAQQAGDGISGVFSQAFTYVVQELGPLLKEVGGQIVELMTLLFEKYIKPHLAKLVMALFGPALFLGITRALGAAILKVGFEKVITGFVNRIPIPPAAGAAGGAADGAGGAAGAATTAGLGAFVVNLVKIAAIVAVIAATVKILMPLILSIARDIENSGLKPESITFTAVLLGIMGVLFIAIGRLMQGVAKAKFKAGAEKQVLLIAGASIIILPAIALVAKLAVHLLGGYPAEEIAKTAFMMTVFTGLFAAIAGLITFMAINGKAIKKGFGQAMSALVIAGVFMVAVGIIALAAVAAFQNFTQEQVNVTISAIGGMTFLFGAIATLFVALSVLGTYVSGSGGAAVGLAVGGFVAAAVTLGLLAVGAKMIINHFKDVDEKQAKIAFIIMDNMVDLFMKVAATIALLTGAAILLKKYGGWAGAAALAIIMYAVYHTMKEMLGFAKDFITVVAKSDITEEKAKAVSTVLDGLAKMLGAVVDGIAKISLISRASVVGAILGVDFGGLNLGKIKDILVGKDGIMIMIQKMLQGEAGKPGLLQIINQLGDDPAQLKTKADVFTSVAAGFAAIMKPIVDIIKAVTDASGNSLLGVLFGGNPENEIRQVIKLLLGEGTTGIFTLLFGSTNGLVPKIIEQIKNINVGQGDALKAGAEVFKSVATGIAAIVQVVPKMIGAVTELADEIPDENVIPTLDKVKDIFTSIISHTSGIITSVGTAITNLLKETTVTPEKLKEAGAIGEIFKGVGEVLKAVTPSPATLKAFQETSSSSGEYSSSSGINSEKLRSYITDMTTNLRNIVGNNDSGILGMLRLIVNMPFSVEDIDKLKGVAPIISAIGNLITNIVPSQNILDRITQNVSGNDSEGGKAGDNRNRIKWFMENVTNSINAIIPTIKTFIVDVARAISNIDASKIEGLKVISPIIAAVGSLIGSIMPATNILERITTTSGSGGLSEDQMKKNKEKITDFFTSINGYITALMFGEQTSSGGTQATGGIVLFINKMKDILNETGLDETRIKGLTVFSEIIKTISSMIVPLIGAVHELTSGVSSAGDTGRIYQAGTQITAVIQALSSSIQSVFNLIPTLISAIAGMNFDTKAIDSKIRAVKGIFELVGVIAMMTTGMSEEVTDARGVKTKKIRDILEMINPPLNLIIGLFSKRDIGSGAGTVRGYGATTEAAFNALASFRLPDGLASKAKVIKTVFEALKALVDATKSLKEMADQNQTVIPQTVLDKPLQSINNMLASLTSTGTSGGANQLMNTDRGNPLSKLGGIADRLRIAGQQFRGIHGNLTFMLDSTNSLSRMQSTGLSSQQLSLNLSKLLGNDSAATGNDRSVLQVLESYFGASTAQDTANRFSNLKDNISRTILTPVRDMIQSYNDFSRQLRNLGNGTAPLQVTLDNLGSRLGATRRVTISNAAVNATINVNVRMEVGDVVQALHTHTTSTRTQANPRTFRGDAFTGAYPNPP